MPYKNKITGIYKILNKITNKCYIGSAISIFNRFSQHKNLLRQNKHFNLHLQSSWNKYGEENFSFEIVEILNKQELQNKEEYYIQIFNSNNPKNGYNKRINCATNLGNKFSKETIEKLKKSHLGHKRSKETQEKISNSQYKPIFQLDSDLNIINSFKSIKEASEKTNYCSKILSACCCLKMKSYPREKYYWCFQKDYKNFKKPIYKRNKK